MKYSLVLQIQDPNLHELLSPEITKFDKTRSTIQITKTKNLTKVKIMAQDAVALRATTDSIIQLLKVYEKLK